MTGRVSAEGADGGACGLGQGKGHPVKLDRAKIMQRVTALGGTVGIVYQDLISGDTFTLNENVPFPAASVIKTNILWGLFRAADAGELSLDDTVTLTAEMKTPGSGVMKNLSPGLTMTLRDLATLMITISDNTATDLVLSRLSIPRINETMRALGLNDTVMVSPMKGLFNKAGKPDHVEQNLTTPADCAKILLAIYRGGILSEKAHAGMMDILTRQDCRLIIPRTMDLKRRVAHKTGKVPTVRHDAGLVLDENAPYLLVLLSKDIGPIEVPRDRSAAEDKLGLLAQCFDPQAA
jgi:beta-lactamase class A